MKNAMNKNNSELRKLCKEVRAFVMNGDMDACLETIRWAMQEYPHAPEPHNLMGIVLEKSGDHSTAMRHFRAALALEPSYLPANHNLHTYGTFYTSGSCAYDEEDLPQAPPSNLEIVYDERGIGRVGYKTKIEYDARGIGRVVRR